MFMVQSLVSSWSLVLPKYWNKFHLQDWYLKPENRCALSGVRCDHPYCLGSVFCLRACLLVSLAAEQVLLFTAQRLMTSGQVCPGRLHSVDTCSHWRVCSHIHSFPDAYSHVLGAALVQWLWQERSQTGSCHHGPYFLGPKRASPPSAPIHGIGNGQDCICLLTLADASGPPSGDTDVLSLGTFPWGISLRVERVSPPGCW